MLHWIAEGKTNQEISIILECSFFTVKNHVKELFQRLGVHTRVGAAACAYRAHLAEEAAGLAPAFTAGQARLSNQTRPGKASAAAAPP